MFTLKFYHCFFEASDTNLVKQRLQYNIALLERLLCCSIVKLVYLNLI